MIGQGPEQGEGGEQRRCEGQQEVPVPGLQHRVHHTLGPGGGGAGGGTPGEPGY